MSDKIVRTSVVCKTEKYIEDFYNEYGVCKQSNIKSVFKRFYDNKDGILQKGRDKYAHFRDLDDRLKALEQKIHKKWLGKQLKLLKNKFFRNHPKRFVPLKKLM